MKRVLAVFLTCVFVLGLLPLPTFALETDSGGLCPHHTEHSYEVCGYIESVEGQPCGHVHNGDCGFAEAAEEIPCDMGCAEAGEDGQTVHDEGCAYTPAAEGAPCLHEHDGECGYVPADPGQPCGYDCRICPVQEMLDALPDAEDVTAGNRAGAEAQLAAIDGARAELTDEEAGELDISRYQAVVSALAALDEQAGAEVPVAAAAEQFPALTPGETYWFDLSGADIPGTVNSAVPDATLHWVPFTYAGTINAYKLTSSQATTQEYAENSQYDHSLFIADYNVTNTVSWNDLNNKDMIFGTAYASGGVDYTMRAPSAGSGFTGSGNSKRGIPESNEWDTILNKSDEYIKNWSGAYSWGQDTSSFYTSSRAIRGSLSARFWSNSSATTRDVSVGFRPVLELPAPDALTSGLQVVTLDLNGGKAGTSDTASVNIVVKSGESFTAPSSEGLTAQWKESFPNWTDSSGNVYEPGDTVPAGVTELTAQWKSLPPRNVTVQTSGNGTASASLNSAIPGTEIILTAEADNGYWFEGWAVISGDATIVDNRFTMPAENVTIRAVFVTERISALTPGETYWFDLSGAEIPGTVNSAVPDATLHWVPFTYAGAVNAYSRTVEGVSTDDSVSPYPHNLFIADYNVTHSVTWNELNNKNMIFGTAYASGGVDYTMRAPSAGSGFTGSGNSERGIPESNEWDEILNKNAGYINNWRNMLSWGQDTYADNSSNRAARGYRSARSFGHYNATYRIAYVGFRPVLEILDPDALGSDGLNVVTLDLNGGKAGTSNAAQSGPVYIVVKSGESFKAPSGEGLTAPEGKGFDAWKDGDGTLYQAGEDIPSTVTALTACWAALPTITEQPQSITVRAGEAATFTIAVSDAGPLTYQWQVRQGGAYGSWEDIPGATESSYTITAAATSMEGWNYRCVVSNRYGSLTSDAASLILDMFPALTPGETYWFDLSGAEIPGTVNSDMPDTTLHWAPFTYTGAINAYKLTSEQATTQEYAATSRYDHSLFIADYNVIHSVSWDDLNNKGMIFGTAYASSGVDYAMRAPSAGSDSTGSGNSQRGIPQSNEWDKILNKSDEYIKNWSGEHSWGQDTNSSSTSHRAVRGWVSARYWRNHSATYRDVLVGFRPVLELPAPDQLASDSLKVVTLDLNGGKAGTSNVAQSGPVRIVVKSGQAFAAPSGESLTAPEGKGFAGWEDGNGTLYQAGEDIPSTVTALTACWTALPTITEQPQSITVRAGEAATFTMTARDTIPFTYQWQISRGGADGPWEDISGATESSYTIAAATVNMDGWYRCVVANRYGSLASDAASLALIQFPALAPGGIYWFDLSGAEIPGTVNSAMPDTTLHWVPFTYAGVVNAYKLASAQATTQEYADTNRYGHSLFIADYNVTHTVPWTELNNKSLIFGTPYTSGGVSYTMRAPSGGSGSTGSGKNVRGTPQSNEWDMILNKSDGHIKNWDWIGSWGQDSTRTSSRVKRGGYGSNSARRMVSSQATGGSAQSGYRPVLEFPAPGTLGSGLRVVTLDLNGGRIGGTWGRSGPCDIVVKSGENFKAPSGEGLTVPDGKPALSGWKGDNGVLYSAGDNVPSTVTKLTALWGLDLADAAVTVSNDGLTYNGQAQTPAVTVTLYGKTLTQGTDYTVSYSNNTNAGTATVTLTGTGSCSGTAETTFEIAPKEITAALTGTTSKTYDGTTEPPAGLSLTLTDVVSGESVTAKAANISYNSANVNEANTITASGITLTGADAGNYRLASSTASVAGTITKSQPAIAFNSGYNPDKAYDGQEVGTPAAGDLTITGAAFDDVRFTWDAAPLNAGTYTLTATIPATDNTETAVATKTVVISRKAVTPTVTITPDSYEYTGSAIQPSGDAVKALDGDKEIASTEYTLSYGENIHVGIGTVTVTDAPGGNYEIAETTQNFTITKKLQDTLSITGKPGTTAYGDTFQLTTGGGSGEGAVTWSVTGPATVSSTGEITITGVGSVTVKAVKAGGGNYEDAEAALTFEAAKKPVTAVVTAANKTYDGSTSATVTAEVTTGLLAGDSITISGVTGAFANANAGAGKTVTVDSSGASISGANADKYQINFPASTTAGIEKANASIATAPAGKTGLTYTGAAQALVTAGTASVGEVVYSLAETGTYSTTIPTGTNAGSYTVWYKIADTDNYNGTAPVKVDVTISKVNYTGEKAGSTSGKYGREKTYDLKNLLPEGYVLGTITTTDTNSIFEGTPTVSGTILTYKLADNAGVGKTGTITIPVIKSTNYNAFNLTITVTVTNVRIPTLTVNPISVTYTGSSVSSSQITGTATLDGRTIAGSWSFAGGQALTNVADSGVKSVVFTPTDTGEYGTASGTVTVTIRKATPSLTLTPSPVTLPNGGTVTLTLTGLPSGGSAGMTCSEASIAVTKGSGNTWTAELPAGGASYTFTATYTGDGNHNGTTANCTVSVDKISPTLKLSPSSDTLLGGGTVVLTLTGLPSGGSATVTCSGGITVAKGTGNTWTATLPNSAATYTFTASYAGNNSYHPASAVCTVETKAVVILPDPPADNGGMKFQLVMETGISQVPAGLQSIETLNTPEKLETAMRTEITQVTSGISPANTAVYNVRLMVSTDGGATWTQATADNFPSGGLTVTLPYPSGTNSSYRFTVVHMFTTSDFGKTPGATEVFTPDKVKNSAQGIQVVVTGLSPISVGWTAPATTPDPSTGGNHGGGGWSSSAYAVTVEKAEHGKVSSNRVNASGGSTVTLTAAPDSGYVLDTLTVSDSLGNKIKLTAQGSGKYTFTMPSRAVTVKATFVPLPDDTQKPCDGGASCPSRSFTDLGSVGTWYHEAVDYVLRNDLMGGYGNGLFGPNDNLSRAQFAQILFNKEGRPVVNYLLQYGDVAEGAWYTEAIRWATSRGIVGGYGNGTFGPNDNITREQLAVMLWRYAGSPAATDKELHFTDADKASGYALEALRWAVENGILNGYGDGRLGPQGQATRAQVAQMLKNFIEHLEEAT